MILTINIIAKKQLLKFLHEYMLSKEKWYKTAYTVWSQLQYKHTEKDQKKIAKLCNLFE